MIADKIKNARTILYYITIIIVGIICTYNLLNVTLSFTKTVISPKLTTSVVGFFYAILSVFLKLSVTFTKLIQ